VERLAGERGLALESAGLEALDRLWDEVKRDPRAVSPSPASGPAPR